MTAKSSKRVVIINNIKSDKIEQAIFILRGSTLQKPDKGILKEAQDIIDNYIKKVGEKEYLPPPNFSSYKEKKKKSFGGIFITLSALLLITLIIMIRKFAGQ